MLEEIYLCTQHIKGFNYSDVMSMPVYERRYYIGMKNQEYNKQVDRDTSSTTQNGKGNRQKKLSGEALKNRLNNGDIPLA